MFSARHIQSRAVLSVLACALLLCAMTGPATAQQDQRGPSARDVENALAQERYYSSYGEPEPLALPQSPAPSGDTPWVLIVLPIAATVAIVAASAAHLRRNRIRRRRAAGATT